MRDKLISRCESTNTTKRQERSRWNLDTGMEPSGDLELPLRTKCVQDESEVPPCKFCKDTHAANITNMEDLPLGVAQGCINCRLLLDAIESWNETENLQLYKYFRYPDFDSSKTWYRPWLELQTKEVYSRVVQLRVSPHASGLFLTISCST